MKEKQVVELLDRLRPPPPPIVVTCRERENYDVTKSKQRGKQQGVYRNEKPNYRRSQPRNDLKRNFLRILGNLESFWGISDISKRVLELFS